MSKVERKSFDHPEETRVFDKARLEVVTLGGVTALRVRFEPGWRWSKCVKPVVGTESCQVGHLIYVVSGRMAVRMEDGSEAELGPGDVGAIPPGHDAWIIGQEVFVGVDFQSVDLARTISIASPTSSTGAGPRRPLSPEDT